MGATSDVAWMARSRLLRMRTMTAVTQDLIAPVWMSPQERSKVLGR